MRDVSFVVSSNVPSIVSSHCVVGPGLRKLMETVFESMLDVSTATLLLVVVMLIFSLLGIQVHAGQRLQKRLSFQSAPQHPGSRVWDAQLSTCVRTTSKAERQTRRHDAHSSA